MKELILQKLKEIEKEHNIRILLAVESGSRAWGFASPDSDYDVRFIYVRPKVDYLRLDEVRDVIELPINDELDINGWDLQKTLRLLYRSNPTLFEWFSSPIVYLETPFASLLRRIMSEYFSQKKSLYHYISMAEGNYREYLKGDMVKAKKYFYVLRPVLACRWILDRGTQPPMKFTELAGSQLPLELAGEVERLLKIKMESPEIMEIPRVAVLNDFLDEQIAQIKARIATLPEERNGGWDKLNGLFLSAIDVRMFYQCTEEGESEECLRERIVLDKPVECYHCGAMIPCGEAAKIITLAGDCYIMHNSCADKGCYMRY